MKFGFNKTSCNKDEQWWLIRDMGTSVTLPDLCYPCVSLMSSDHWLARRAAGSPGAEPWPSVCEVSGVGFYCQLCLLPPFVGLTDCCSLCTLGSSPKHTPSLPVASPEAIIVLPMCLFIQIWPFYIRIQSDFTNHKQDDILIVICFTKRFTTVHF